MQVASCGGGGGLISKSDSVRDKYFARVCDLLWKYLHKTSSTGSRCPEKRQEVRNLRKDGGLGALVGPIDDCMKAGRGLRNRVTDWMKSWEERPSNELLSYILEAVQARARQAA